MRNRILVFCTRKLHHYRFKQFDMTAAEIVYQSDLYNYKSMTPLFA
jgi:hypothetical protein